MATQTKTPETNAKEHTAPDAVQQVEKDVKPLQAFFTKFMNDWCMNLAAALAYNLLMAIFPIALAILSILGFIFGILNPQAYHDLIYTRLGSIFPLAVSSGVILNITAQLSRSSGFLAILAVVLAIFNGSRLFVLIEAIFGIIYHVRQRAFLQQNLMAIGMLLLFVVLIPIMVLVSAGPALVITILKNTPLSQVPGIPFFFSLGGIVGGLLASWILFEAIYVVVPNQRISFRNSWLGALVAAVALELYLILFPLYISRFLNGYVGQAGFAVILLVFFYYFAVILLLGAEVNAFFAEKIESTPYDLVTLVHLTTSHLPKSPEEYQKQAAQSHKDTSTGSAANKGKKDTSSKKAHDTAAQVSKITTASTPHEQQTATPIHEQQQMQPAHEEHLSKKHKEHKSEKQAKKGPSKVATAIEAIAGTALAFGIELMRLRHRR